MQKKVKQEELLMSSKITNPNLKMLKEAANTMGLGIISQESENHEMSQTLMKIGIDKIKEILLKEKSLNNKLIFDYVSIILGNKYYSTQYSISSYKVKLRTKSK